MACRCAPALLTARNELNAVYPLRDKASDGCCGDAAHAARKSDHNPNIEGFARAYDYDEDIVEGMGDRELTGMGLVLLGDKRTKYLIYEAQLLYPDGTVKPYTGINAHRSHLHHSIHDWAVGDTRPWGIARAFHAPEEDDMPLNAADLDSIEKRVIAALDKRGVSGSDSRDAAILAALGTAGTVSAADIAAAIPDGLAQAVADELAERLKG